MGSRTANSSYGTPKWSRNISSSRAQGSSATSVSAKRLTSPCTPWAMSTMFKGLPLLCRQGARADGLGGVDDLTGSERLGRKTRAAGRNDLGAGAADDDLDRVGGLGLWSFGCGSDVDDWTSQGVLAADDGVDDLPGEARSAERHVSGRREVLYWQLSRLRLGSGDEGADVGQVDAFFLGIPHDRVADKDRDDLVELLEALFHVVDREG